MVGDRRAAYAPDVRCDTGAEHEGEGNITLLKRYWAYAVVFAIGMVSVVAPSGSVITLPALIALLVGAVGLILWGRSVAYAFSDALVESKYALIDRFKPNIMLWHMRTPWVFPASSDPQVLKDPALAPLARRYRLHLYARVALFVSMALAAWLRSLA